MLQLLLQVPSALDCSVGGRCRRLLLLLKVLQEVGLRELRLRLRLLMRLLRLLAGEPTVLLLLLLIWKMACIVTPTGTDVGKMMRRGRSIWQTIHAHAWRTGIRHGPRRRARRGGCEWVHDLNGRDGRRGSSCRGGRADIPASGSSQHGPGACNATCHRAAKIRRATPTDGVHERRAHRYGRRGAH